MREQQRIQCVLMVACFSVLTIACDALSDVKSVGCGQDAPLKSYQIELLNIAFKAASAMPLDPHIKSRSRAQQTVVTTCLELKQPQRALQYVERIDNWRGGMGFADLASYYAQHGAMKKNVELYLVRAAEVAAKTEGWRSEHIRAKIDEVRGLQERHEQADRSNRTKTQTCPPDSFDEEMKRLDKIVSAGDFDLVKNALERYSELYGCHYEDPKRRTLIENRIKASWGKMPILIRINTLSELADCALDNRDHTTAIRLVDESGTMIHSFTWQPRFEIPLRAGLAEFRFRCGEKEKARAELRKALETFDVNRKKIVNIDKAGILRSVAEAYQNIGDTKRARNLYRRALEAGIENPNSRPRAEDLNATCRSMALHEVEPDNELWERIHKIHGNLGDPW